MRGGAARNSYSTRVTSVIAWALGAVLVGGAAAKLAAPRRSAAALATFGLRAPGARLAVLVAVCALELVLGAAVALGSHGAARLAAAVVAAFGVLLLVALLAGRRGRPCGCFGPRSVVGAAAVARNALLAGALAALPLLDDLAVSRARWTEVLLGLALAGVAALGLMVAGLARELAALRMRIGPQVPLDIAGEGPPIGSRHPALRRDGRDAPELGVSVFTSAGCAMCAALAPAIAELRGDPRLALATHDEIEDHVLWERLAIPGSPYAVVSDRDGVVRAKGTFNSLGQLDSLVAWALEGGREPVAAGA